MWLSALLGFLSGRPVGLQARHALSSWGESDRAGCPSASRKPAVWNGCGEVGCLTGTSALAAFSEPALPAIKLMDGSLCDSCINFFVSSGTRGLGDGGSFLGDIPAAKSSFPGHQPSVSPVYTTAPLWLSWPVRWCLPCLDESSVLVYVFSPHRLSYSGQTEVPVTCKLAGSSHPGMKFAAPGESPRCCPVSTFISWADPVALVPRMLCGSELIPAPDFRGKVDPMPFPSCTATVFSVSTFLRGF